MSDTTFSESAFKDIKAVTPTFVFNTPYVDADDELSVLANYIKTHTPHNSEIEVERIKFLYTDKPKKDGPNYTAGYITVRNDVERAVDGRYDYIVCVFYPVWHDLDTKTKVIQLDKILCAIKISIDKEGNKQIKKEAIDSKEFVCNMNHFGIMDVLKSSETIHLTTLQVIERMKDQKKNGPTMDNTDLEGPNDAQFSDEDFDNEGDNENE